MEISRTDRVKNEVLPSVKEKKKANWTGHILRGNCVLKHILEGKTQGTRRRGIRREQLLDDLKEKRRNWNLTEEALEGTL
jgi:ribosomal protein L35